MRRLFIGVSAILLALAAADLAVALPMTVDLELVLAVDVSRSIDDDEYNLQKQGYADAFTHPAVLSAIQANPHHRIAVTMVEWAGADFQKVVVPWTVISDPESGVGNVKSDVLNRLWVMFKQHGIELPVPQRQIRLTTAEKRD